MGDARRLQPVADIARHDERSAARQHAGLARAGAGVGSEGTRCWQARDARAGRTGSPSSIAIGRPRTAAQTGGGMTASLVLHVGLLLLLVVVAGGKVAQDYIENELTEIAYIEARYGEDVAAKVKLKEKSRRPEPPGRGRPPRGARWPGRRG